ncbi:MAG: D-glycerate dehydrogenase [Candidatus Paceibacterota bacterium]
MSKLIYITRRIPENGVALLKEKGYTVDVGEKEEAPTHKELVHALSQKPYDAVICFLTDEVDAALFDACPTAKIFAQYSVGYNNINIEEAKKRNVVVTNTPGTSSRAVAEHAVALMLSLTTRTIEGDLFMRADKYKGWSPYLFNGTDLTGKTIGLFGGGAIGQEVAAIVHGGFNCPIIYSDVARNSVIEEKYGATYVDKETLLQTSDIISLHVPLLPSTKHLIDKDALLQMKKSAFLINTSRGPVVDEGALIIALTGGLIKGAGLDVYEFEPSVSRELLALPNVVLTPHIASSRDSVRQKMSESVAENVIHFFEKGKGLNEVTV